jgi:hypothetical protein
MYLNESRKSNRVFPTMARMCSTPGDACSKPSNGRDALPCDPRHDGRWLSSGAAPLMVYAFRRVRRSTSTDARSRPATPDAPECIYRRRRVHRTRPSNVMTRITRERVPTCVGGRAARSYYFSGRPLRNNSLTVSPFLERFLAQDRSNPFSRSAIRQYSRSRPES